MYINKASIYSEMTINFIYMFDERLYYCLNVNPLIPQITELHKKTPLAFILEEFCRSDCNRIIHSNLFYRLSEFTSCTATL
jgi:hypothetical protein